MGSCAVELALGCLALGGGGVAFPARGFTLSDGCISVGYGRLALGVSESIALCTLSSRLRGCRPSEDSLQQVVSSLISLFPLLVLDGSSPQVVVHHSRAV
ncbi:MAG TPA: hypothetical protein VMB05_14570 [Solirubrobacteraceae bacterium]|nr:hypothetical protein [Solirubrobacteraceae bacterium]